MKTSKDPIINARSTTRSKDSKGRDVLALSIGGEGERNAGQIDLLIEALVAVKNNPSGVKLKIHTEQKEYEGRTFDSSFMFVAPVGEAPRRASPTRFVPVASSVTETTDARIAAIKSQSIK